MNMGDDADSAERDAHWARLVKEAEAAKDRERLAAEKYAREEPARREAARAAQERREAEQAALEAEQAALKAKAELESAERERVRIEAEMRVNGDVEDLDEAAYLHWARRTASARFFVYNAARHANPRDEAQPQPNVSADSRLTSLVRLWTQSGGLIAGLVCMIATEQLIRFESNSVHNFSGYGFVALLLEAAAFATGYLLWMYATRTTKEIDPKARAASTNVVTLPDERLRKLILSSYNDGILAGSKESDLTEPAEIE